MNKEYIVNRQGKDFVLYEGLLDEAHRQGLKRVSTTLIQLPTDENGQTAVVQAEVETEKGVFAGIGDANPRNVNRMILPHTIRMAETRAKARALRDAVNVGVAAIEELSGAEEDRDEGETKGKTKRTANERFVANFGATKPATTNQVATIAKLSRLVGEDEPDFEGMTSAEASEHITELSHMYNDRKTARSA
ncbi:MAG: hypothetical protein ACRDFS_04470 [Chloroflexota bacterium]